MATDTAASYAVSADFNSSARDVCFGCKNQILLFLNDQVQKTCGAFTRNLVNVGGEYRYKANLVLGDNQRLSEGLGANPRCEAVRTNKDSCKFREEITPFAFDESARKPIAIIQDVSHPLHNPRFG